MKPATKSAAAAADIREAAVYYRDEGDAQLALDFIDSVESAVRHIVTWPAAGSTRFADILNLPGLRTVSLGRFPFIIFYVETFDHVDIWRVLHDRRDIPQILIENESTLL